MSKSTDLLEGAPSAHSLSEAEIDEIVTAQADDDSAWENPRGVQRPTDTTKPEDIPRGSKNQHSSQ
jgi:hypothetical protein